MLWAKPNCIARIYGLANAAHAKYSDRLLGPLDPRPLNPDVVVDQYQIRAVAGCDAPKLVPQAEKLRRIFAGHASGRDDAESQGEDRVTHRTRHVERRAGESAVFVPARPIDDP